MSSINNLNLSDEELLMVEQMGSTGFGWQDIAEVLELDPLQLEAEFTNQESQIYKRYRKGFLASALKLRLRIFKDAGHGSSPAQALAKKIMDDCDFKNNALQ